ncbi:hypothetical protein PENSPDRAFT_756805 [Peniophora sp. CONT]|nr:hypothetical protein PENSPDRAFT_756805 [Peniophora sp. CONT]
MDVGNGPGAPELYKRLHTLTRTSHPVHSSPAASTSASLPPGLAAPSVSRSDHANVPAPLRRQLVSTSRQAYSAVDLPSGSAIRTGEGATPPNKPTTAKKPKLPLRAPQEEVNGSRGVQKGAYFAGAAGISQHQPSHRRLARRTATPKVARPDRPGSSSDGLAQTSRGRRPTHGNVPSSGPFMGAEQSAQTGHAGSGHVRTIETSDLDGGSYRTFQLDVASARRSQSPSVSQSTNTSGGVKSVSNGGAVTPVPRRSSTMMIALGSEVAGVIGPSHVGNELQLSEKAKGKRRADSLVDAEHPVARKRKKVAKNPNEPPTSAPSGIPSAAALTGSAVPLSRASATGSGPLSSLSSVRTGPARKKKPAVLLDSNGVPLPAPVGIKSVKQKKGRQPTPWKLVRPAGTANSTDSARSTPPGTPRIWCSSFDDLEAAAPVYKRSDSWYGVRRGILDVPTLLFLDPNDKQSALGMHPGDRWDGRQLIFTMCYEYKPTSTGEQPSLKPKKKKTDKAALSVAAAPTSTSVPPVIAPQMEPSTSNSSGYSSLVVSDVEMETAREAELIRDADSATKRPAPAPSASSAMPAYATTEVKIEDSTPSSYGGAIGFGPAPSATAHMRTEIDMTMPAMSLDAPFPTAASSPASVTVKAELLDEDDPMSGSRAPATLSPAIPHIHPPPPSEVQMLLDTHQRKGPVAPVVSRSSPIMPWLLPDSVGCVWAGLFTIECVEESTQIGVSTSPNTVRRSWAFRLRWIPGGELMLRDEEDEEEYKDWPATVERPWWETEADISPPSDPNGAEAEFYGELVSFIIPSGLLATFKTILLGESNFPHGFYCRTCGRINVQVSLVRQDCLTATCAASTPASTAPATAAQWVPARTCVFAMADSAWVPAVVTRVLKLNGMSTRTYSVPNGADIYAPPPEGTALHMTATHIFTSNMPERQEQPSALFETIQQCIPFQRSKTEFSFFASTTFPPSESDVQNRANEVNAFALASRLIRFRVAQYGDGVGTLETKKLTIKTWIAMKDSRVKEKLPVVPEGGFLAIMCLGANTQVSYTPLAMKPAMKNDKRYKAAARKEALRVMLIHGDILVLSGAAIEAGLQVGLLRTGTTMLLIAECIKAA